VVVKAIRAVTDSVRLVLVLVAARPALLHRRPRRAPLSPRVRPWDGTWQDRRMREWWERDGRRTVIAIVIGVVLALVIALLAISQER
jgi:hypothetical protein